MAIKHQVNLTIEDKEQLEQITKKGKIQARKLKRVQILLMSSAGYKDEEIANIIGVSVATIERIRKKFVSSGLESALNEKPRPGKVRKLNGTAEAFLVATACSNPPSGRECWTMELLANKLVQLEIVDNISDETVRRTLKKTKSSRG
ncbi:transposase (plasmid) [Nostoc carneum NIES-2107]|nr:transposase [Nostoc carneum NIES-2107]BAY28731.1 transposase [Nostoc carneum NIES-2107]BAY28951.1 transposase [Nostoc carneum NIES-2107]BAY30560.1 transposase [Nostoc carneum NIES-2107]BAY31072.1 transposase [Nostoc carneum NIES-2107]